MAYWAPAWAFHPANPLWPLKEGSLSCNTQYSERQGSPFGAASGSGVVVRMSAIIAASSTFCRLRYVAQGKRERTLITKQGKYEPLHHVYLVWCWGRTCHLGNASLGHWIHRNHKQGSPFRAGLTATAVPGVVMAAKVTLFYSLWYMGQGRHL